MQSVQIESHKDILLARRALREGWAMTDEVRKAVLNQLSVIALRGDRERDRIAAAKALVEVDKLAMSQEAAEHQRQLDEFDRRAKLLEYAQSRPIAEIVSRAEAAGIEIEGIAERREAGSTGVDGTQEGSGAGDSDRNSGELGTQDRDAGES